MNNPQSGIARSYVLLPLILIISLFFLWGVANNLNDILIGQFKKAFSLSDFQSGLVQSAFYFGYFVFAMPAAIFMQRCGYKAAVIFGLALYGLGALLFYPAAEVQQYSFFLGALFIIASGLAFLETSANPLVVAMGDPATAERRLNFAQAFNPLGAISGVLIGREFILSGVEHTPEELMAMSASEAARFYDLEAQAVQGPYLVLGLVVLFWALVVLIVKFPAVASREAARREDTGKLRDFKELFKHRHFIFGVVAQFFYVGAQVGIWSFFIRYGQLATPGLGEKALAAYLTWSLVAFMVGRFVATALMGKFSAAFLMRVFALINVALCMVAIAVPTSLGLIALASTSFFMSLMFPTIFALSLRGLGPLSKAGSSFLIMAIIGGAILTAVMGYLSDLTSINIAMLVPLTSFVVIACFAVASTNTVAQATEQQALGESAS